MEDGADWGADDGTKKCTPPDMPYHKLIVIVAGSLCAEIMGPLPPL